MFSSCSPLSPSDVEFYKSEGYFVYKSPVLSSDKFGQLKQYFEEILADLDENERERWWWKYDVDR